MAQQSSVNKASVTSFAPDNEKKPQLDTNPSDQQPPGVDEEWEPQSLEEALLGE